MDTPQFTAKRRPNQTIAIAEHLRFGIYVLNEKLTWNFDGVAVDHNLMKVFAERPERRERALLSNWKMAHRLSIEVVPAANCKKMFETFLPYFGADETLIEAFERADELVEITAYDSMAAPMSGLRIVQFAAAHLAQTSKGTVLDPLAYKIYRPDTHEIVAMQERAVANPRETIDIASLLTVVQTLEVGNESRILSTSYGLCRFGLPEIAIARGAVKDAPAIKKLIELLAQSLLQSVIQSAAAGKVEHSLSAPLVVPELGPVPMRLQNSPFGFVVEIDRHGRQQDKDQTLGDLLARLGI